MRSIIAILLIFFLVFGQISFTSSAAEVSLPIESSQEYSITRYTYPITSDADNWFEYTVQEKVDILRIPDDVLSQMTDEALVTAIAEYPYLVDIYLYGDSVEIGIEVSRSYFSALDELLSRDTAVQALYTYIENISSTNSLNNSTEPEFSYFALSDILSTLQCTLVFFPTTIGTDTVLTPKGSEVSVTLYIENDTPAEHKEADIDEIVSKYGVELVEPGSCCYNCHHFAWYMNGSFDADRRVWMPDPSAYMKDGSYQEIYTGTLSTLSYNTSIQKGDIIFYGDLSDNGNDWHSAIYDANAVTGAPISTQMCISKWGGYGVFRHTMGNVPAAYNTENISAWRITG